jgi:hypothetical protein
VQVACPRRRGRAFERLWEETGCRTVITELAGKRKHGFALERAVFLTVLHRLFVSGSDRAAGRAASWSGWCARVRGLPPKPWC